MSGVELGSAHVSIRADQDKLKGDLDGAQNVVSSAMGNVAKVAAGAGLAIGAAFVAAGVAAFKLGESFDSAYDTIRAGTGATGDALEGLKTDFKAVASSVPDGFETVSAVITDLNKRTGATGETLQNLSKTVLDFSRVTGTDAAGNVALATRMFGDWSIATEDQAGSMDMVFRASQATGIGVQELMGKVVQFGAPLRAMGFSMEESAVMMGKWEKEGVNTELVLGSMRIAMGKFADAGIPAREGLNKTIAEIQRLGPSAEATAMAMDVFGARAGPDMAAAILEGRFELGALFEQVANGGETVSGAATETADGAERMQLAMNRVSVALEPVASGVFNVVGLLVEKMAPAIEGMVTGLAPLIAIIGAELVPAVERVFEWLGKLAEGWQKSTSTVTTETSALWTFLQPVFDALARNLAVFAEEIFPELEKTWAVVVAGVTAATAEFSRLWAFHWDTISKVLEVVMAVLTVAIDTAFGAVKASISIVLALIRGDWEGAWNSVLAYFRTVWTGITRVFQAVLPLMEEAMASAWGRIQAEFSSAWETIKRTFNGALEILSTAFRNAGPALLGLLKQGLDAAWGGVIANVQAGVARIAALFPHSEADEGPLSVPISWQTILWGDLRTVMPEVVAAMAVGADLIAEQFEDLTLAVRAERMGIDAELLQLTESFAATAAAATAAVAVIESVSGGDGGGGGGGQGDWNAVSGGALAGAMASYQNQTHAALLNAGTASSGIGSGVVGVSTPFTNSGGLSGMVIEIDGLAIGRAVASYVAPEIIRQDGSFVPL